MKGEGRTGKKKQNGWKRRGGRKRERNGKGDMKEKGRVYRGEGPDRRRSYTFYFMTRRFGPGGGHTEQYVDT